MSEQWRPCPGFEERYAVSDMGRVMRLPKVAGGKAKVLATGANRDPSNKGYIRVGLFGPYGATTAYLHRLVALAFVDGYEDGKEVNHINGDKTDNRASNLEWVTHEENQRHASEVLGRLSAPRKAIRLLSDEEVAEIRASGETQRVLAARYGVSQVTICQIRRGRIYRDLPGGGDGWLAGDA